MYVHIHRYTHTHRYIYIYYNKQNYMTYECVCMHVYIYAYAHIHAHLYHRHAHANRQYHSLSIWCEWVVFFGASLRSGPDNEVLRQHPHWSSRANRNGGIRHRLARLAALHIHWVGFNFNKRNRRHRSDNHSWSTKQATSVGYSMHVNTKHHLESSTRWNPYLNQHLPSR